ncbi:MAG: DUF2220 family protein [Verrucomicrobia bacterium]|nr:DUF2220 family protein [Verrucomicrobiota bacterium]
MKPTEEQVPHKATGLPVVLLALAENYRRSKAGREGGTGDFLADFRDLLAAAASTDGEARVRAVEDLRRAAHESGGRLSLDFHPRDPNIIYQVRLRPAGESWLFHHLGQVPPAARRAELAAWFREQALAAAPHPGWQPWLLALSARALAGLSVLPFERDDQPLNAELLRVSAAVLTWSDESLIRYASAVICGDSKRLQALETRLLQALRTVTGDPATTLETFRILHTPRTVLLHGPLLLDLPGGTLNFSLLRGPVAVSGTDLAAARAIRCAAPACLTVENESVFLELAKRHPDLLLVHTSFPGAATRHLLSHLPATLPCCHFGDTDPAGFDILRDLREKTKRQFQPIGMTFRPDPRAPSLTVPERKTLRRLLASPVLADVYPELQAMLAHGSKGAFEQESLGQAGLQLVAAYFLQV